MSAVPKPSFNTTTSPFPFQQQGKVNFDDLPPDIKQQLANAYAVQSQQPQGWQPTKAPTVNLSPPNPSGQITANIPFPGPSSQPAAIQPQQAQMPQYVQQQFQPAATQPQQWSPAPAPVQQQQFTPSPVQQASGRPRVVFLICSHRQTDVLFSKVLMRLANLGNTAGCEWTYLLGWKYGLAETRMRLLLDAMNIPGVTHVCYLDADIIPDGDDALAYLLSDNLPFVSGLYWNSFNSGFAAWVGGQVIGPEQASPVVPVDQVGIGFTLIHVSVFQTLKDKGAPWPWFYLHIDNNIQHSEYGEDFFFENLCVQCGIRPHVDFRAKCSHLKTIVYNWKGEIT